MIKRRTINRAYNSLYRIKLYIEDIANSIEIRKYQEIDKEEVIAYLKSLNEDINNLHNFIINIENKNKKIKNIGNDVLYYFIGIVKINVFLIIII